MNPARVFSLFNLARGLMPVRVSAATRSLPLLRATSVRSYSTPPPASTPTPDASTQNEIPKQPTSQQTTSTQNTSTSIGPALASSDGQSTAPPTPPEYPYVPANEWTSAVLLLIGFVPAEEADFKKFFGAKEAVPQHLQKYNKEDFDVDWLKSKDYEKKLAAMQAPDNILEFFDILKHAAIVNRTNEGATDYLASSLLHITGLVNPPFVLRPKESYPLLMSNKISYCKPDFTLLHKTSNSILIMQEDKSGSQTDTDPLAQSVAGAYSAIRAYFLAHPHKPFASERIFLITLTGELLQFAWVEFTPEMFECIRVGKRFSKDVVITHYPVLSLLRTNDRQTIFEGMATLRTLLLAKHG